MSKLSFFCLVLFISFVATQLPSGYEVAKWRGFKGGCVTYSFDDNTANQATTVLPLLDKHGLKATFNLVTGWNPNWGAFKQAAQNGHEMASHTVSHANVNAAGENELSGSKQTIQQQTGSECITIAYPNCVGGNAGTLGKYYIAGRTCSGQLNPSNPNDMWNLSSFICGNTGSIQTANDLNGKANQAAQQGGWAVFLIHGIDGDGGYSPISSQALDQHFGFVKTANVWVATFKDAVKYIMEARSLVIKENGSDIQVSTTAQSSLTKFDVPVTIAKKINGASASVTSNGSPVQSTVNQGKLIFDVVPGNTYTIKE